MSTYASSFSSLVLSFLTSLLFLLQYTTNSQSVLSYLDHTISNCIVCVIMNNYLTTLQTIDDPKSMKWIGDCFLPSCSCGSPPSLHHLCHPCDDLTPVCRNHNCTSSPEVFDFKSITDVDTSSLTNLSNYIDPSSNGRDVIGYWLCNKYSIRFIHLDRAVELFHLYRNEPKDFLTSPEFKECYKLLHSDFNILSPFSKCKFTISKKEVSTRFVKYMLRCSQSRAYQASPPPKNPKESFRTRKNETSKPTTKHHRCPFSFNLFFDFNLYRWYIKPNNICSHSHHHPTYLEDFKYERRHLSPSVAEELSKLEKGKISTSSQINVVMKNNDTVLSRHTVFNNMKASIEQNLLQKTDCECLLQALEEEKNVTYFALYGQSINSTLLTIPITKRANKIFKNQTTSVYQSTPSDKEQQSMSLMELLHSEQHQRNSLNSRSDLQNNNNTNFTSSHQIFSTENNSTFPNYFNEEQYDPTSYSTVDIQGSITTKELGSNTPTISLFSNSRIETADRALLRDLIVRESNGKLDADSGQLKVLLCCGWAFNDDLAELRKFPEVLHMDTTFKTNREGRPLFNIVIKDSNNKLRTVFRCLLPSEKQCMFDTILSSAIPRILGKETCDRVQLIITDGDSTEINAVNAALKHHFKNASHNSCLWHLIIQPIKSKSKISNIRLRNIMQSWLWFIATKTETTDEQNQLIINLKVSYLFIQMIDIKYNVRRLISPLQVLL